MITLLVAANLPGTVSYARDLHEKGFGYTSRAWQNSTLIKALPSIPADKTIISNDPGAILFFTGRPAIDLTPVIKQTKHDEIPGILQDDSVALVLFEDKLASQLRPVYGEESRSVC